VAYNHRTLNGVKATLNSVGTRVEPRADARPFAKAQRDGRFYIFKEGVQV